jgi:hypothetical protein
MSRRDEVDQSVVVELIPVPERGIYGRRDLDDQCLFELDEFTNSVLGEFATDDPGAVDKLYLVAVNPDGWRRASHDRLCCWAPKKLAQQLRDRILHDEEFDKYRQVFESIKRFRRKAWERLQQEASARKEHESEMRRRQDVWEQEQLQKDC